MENIEKAQRLSEIIFNNLEVILDDWSIHHTRNYEVDSENSNIVYCALNIYRIKNETDFITFMIEIDLTDNSNYYSWGLTFYNDSYDEKEECGIENWSVEEVPTENSFIAKLLSEYACRNDKLLFCVDDMTAELFEDYS